MADRWYIEEGQGRTPVVLNENGDAVAPVGPTYKENGKHYRREVWREGQVVPAAPGWYAALVWWNAISMDGDDRQIERWPIIAWEVADYGDAYVVSDDLHGPAVQRLDNLGRGDLAPLGIFHEQYRPEPDDIDNLARIEAREAADTELMRQRARAAEARAAEALNGAPVESG